MADEPISRPIPARTHAVERPHAVRQKPRLEGHDVAGRLCVLEAVVVLLLRRERARDPAYAHLLEGELKAGVEQARASWFVGGLDGHAKADDHAGDYLAHLLEEAAS